MELRPITWLGDSREVVRGFSKPVKDRAGDELYRLQIGRDPESWRPMSGIGPGVREIRISVSGEFRVIYVIRKADRIVVLHAFQKKTQQTSKSDIDIARQRLKQL